MAVLDEKGGDRCHSWSCKNGEEVVESLCMVQEADNCPARDKNLVGCGVEECPRHDETKIQNQRFRHYGCHGLPLSHVLESHAQKIARKLALVIDLAQSAPD